MFSSFQNWYKIAISRRTMLRRLGWAGVITFITGSVISSARFFFPRVLFEPPARFKAGRPSDYPAGSVSTAFKDRFRVWIIRREDGKFFCLLAKCTHLGCTPNWKPSEGIFHCPCHGSKFYRNGVNFAGPAPRPLDRFKVTLGTDGQLVVDKSIMYKGIAGLDPDDIYPQSLLRA
ncbi:MAG: ubiquinol-cytochrome c reductase iron-sulfur subunit [Fidelibacterota bacterium]